MEPVTAPSNLSGTSFDDEIIAIDMQLQEIQSRYGVEKQKYREGRIPDREVALYDFEIELTRLLTSFSDQNFARSLQQAMDDDVFILEEATAEEVQAQGDRTLALSIGDGNLDADNSEITMGADGGRENSSVTKRRSIASIVNECNDDNCAGPSDPSPQRRYDALKHSSSHRVDCVTCRDAFYLSELIRCPCGDLYCSECLKSLFIRSIKDETLFPPRCCSERIPLSMIETKLSDEELLSFEYATVEFTTTDRTYCAQKGCGRFVPPNPTDSGHIVCPACNTETCTYCKGLSHDGDCPEDRALQAVLELAEGQRWRRCFRCKTMVELNIGCNHITCKCAAEFCYTCGVQWKNCTCDVWEERNLLNRAEQVVDRDAYRPMAPPERQRRVVEMRQELQANHECNHPGRWEKQMGYSRQGFKCEICYTRHWKYILKCRRCHLVACEECRRHRV